MVAFSKSRHGWAWKWGRFDFELISKRSTWTDFSCRVLMSTRATICGLQRKKQCLFWLDIFILFPSWGNCNHSFFIRLFLGQVDWSLDGSARPFKIAAELSVMRFLFSLIIILLEKGNSSPDNPGDELDSDLSIDEQKIDFPGIETDVAHPIALGNLAAGQNDINESIDQMSVADLEGGTAYPSGTKDCSSWYFRGNNPAKLREPEYPVIELADFISSQFDSSVPDQGFGVVQESCSSDNTPTKLEKPEEEGNSGPEGEGRFRSCPRNPVFTVGNHKRNNCLTSKDTFCALGPVHFPYVDNCIGGMSALDPALFSRDPIGEN